MKYDVILFDIDGTLCDPGTGITDAVQYALLKLGIDEQNHEALKRFVGPQLEHSFRDYYGFSSSQVDEAVRIYREYYKQEGLNAYKAYTGIVELLQELRSQSITLGVVTAKINEFAEHALTSTRLLDCFDFVCGRHPDDVVTKSVTLSHAIKKVSNTPLSSIIMVGDREHDIIAANDNKIDSIGVLYGYGTRQELQDSGATYIAEDVNSIKRILFSKN
jgi:phosphoglycolate phosphatase